MAALPSVILGFLAGLWLAPLIGKDFSCNHIDAILSFCSLLQGAFFIWKCIPGKIKGRYSNGTEALFLIPFFIAAILLSIYLGGAFEVVSSKWRLQRMVPGCSGSAV